MQDYPEHRLHFFSLLRAITNNCFPTLFAMSPQQLQLVINSIIWAFRHTVRPIGFMQMLLLHLFPSSSRHAVQGRIVPQPEAPWQLQAWHVGPAAFLSVACSTLIGPSD